MGKNVADIKLTANSGIELPLPNPKDVKKVLILGNTIGFFGYPGEGCNISNIHGEDAKRFAWMYNCALLGVEIEILGEIEEFEYYSDLFQKIKERYGYEADVTFVEMKKNEDYDTALETYIDEMEDTGKKKKFDVIIANPPYGKVGNEITKKIIKEIDYKFFVNLLPANDWRRSKKDALWQYIDLGSMHTIQNAFSDAVVTTMVCKVNKGRNTSLTESEFEIMNYTDPQLEKYFRENVKREHYAIDAGKYPTKYEDVKDTVNPKTSFTIHSRDMNHGYIPKEGKATSVKWNINKEIDIEYMYKHYWTMGGGRQSTYAFITFNTEDEKDNFTKFMLGDGWNFICKIMKALNADGSVAFSKWIPKVDWTKSQTVQSILQDYGYTPDEIEAVIVDLGRYRGMEK